ncbi:MAG: HU family DNA-binding protein [Candidatus Kerfeldbacteria bacterium]|nr:HU family DNA-binding protein [Candidatus Kerfeldbacteria bacterium]
MSKAELMEQLASRSGVTKQQAEQIMEAFEQLVIDTIKAGGEVTLTGFGTFSAKLRAARMGVNPQNPSEKIQIPQVVIPKFKAGKALKDALKK